jgi:hypothetical protein
MIDLPAGISLLLTTGDVARPFDPALVDHLQRGREITVVHELGLGHRAERVAALLRARGFSDVTTCVAVVRDIGGEA